MPRSGGGIRSEQFAFTPLQVEGGTTVDEICRKLGRSEPTLTRRKRQFAWIGAVKIRRLARLVADLSLDKIMLQDVLRKER